MKEYLKMADVFPSEMRVGGDSDNLIIDDVGIIIGCYSGDKMAEHVLHAINSHDELVAEIERLRGDLLGMCISQIIREASDRDSVPVDEISWCSWVEVFGSTSGPRGGVGGQMMAPFQVYGVDTGIAKYKVCCGVWRRWRGEFMERF